MTSASPPSYSGRLRASSRVLGPGIPTRSATAPTVSGLSPESTLIVMPWASRYPIVACASARSRSSNTSRAEGQARPAGLSPSSASSAGQEQHPPADRRVLGNLSRASGAQLG